MNQEMNQALNDTRIISFTLWHFWIKLFFRHPRKIFHVSHVYESLISIDLFDVLDWNSSFSLLRNSVFARKKWKSTFNYEAAERIHRRRRVECKKAKDEITINYIEKLDEKERSITGERWKRKQQQQHQHRIGWWYLHTSLQRPVVL